MSVSQRGMPIGNGAPSPSSEQDERFQVPPPPPFGPATWNYVYYAILAFSLLIGLLTLLNGGGVLDALLRFFIALLGSAMLSVAFLTFVVIPLHVRRYERLVEAQRAAQAEALEKQAQSRRSKSQRETVYPEPSVPDTEPLEDASTLDEAESSSAVPGHYPEPSHDDQASSLRRMVAGANT